jgi:hypothetical protein
MHLTAPVCDWKFGYLRWTRECNDCGWSAGWWGYGTMPYVVTDPGDEKGAAEVLQSLLSIRHVC